MPQPSKGAAVFLTLFGLPFLGAGLAFIYAQLVSRENFTTTSTVAAVVFGLVFASIGGGLIYAAIGGYSRLKKQAAVRKPIHSLPGCGGRIGLRAAPKVKTR